jgi:Family of unknown function (DUF6459)
MTITLVRPLGSGSGTSGVRLRPAPGFDPPYDDEPDQPVFDGFPVDRAGSDEPAEVPPQPGEAYRAVRRYLDLTLEVLGGFRPIAHLRSFTELGQFDEVTGQLIRLGRAAETRPGTGPVRVPADRLRLRHLRVCEVRPGIVEGAAVLGRGELVRAVTLRLERRSGVWLCTHYEVL